MRINSPNNLAYDHDLVIHYYNSRFDISVSVDFTIFILFLSLLFTQLTILGSHSIYEEYKKKFNE